MPTILDRFGETPVFRALVNFKDSVCSVSRTIQESSKALLTSTIKGCLPPCVNVVPLSKTFPDEEELKPLFPSLSATPNSPMAVDVLAQDEVMDVVPAFSENPADHLVEEVAPLDKSGSVSPIGDSSSEYLFYQDMVVLNANPLVLDESRYGQLEHVVPLAQLDIQSDNAALIKAKQLTKSSVDMRFGHLSADSLSQALLLRPRILHLNCHGQQTPQGYVLAFESATGSSDLFTCERLRLLLSALSSPSLLPELVFLSACSSEPAAREFVKAGVRHVIACREGHRLSDKAAVCFSQQFYSALFAGHSVQRAFECAQASVRIQLDLVGSVSHAPSVAPVPAAAAAAQDPGAAAVDGSDLQRTCTTESEQATPVISHEADKFVLLPGFDHACSFRFQSTPGYGGKVEEHEVVVPSVLPYEPDFFVSRNAEVHRVLALLHVHRCVNIFGDKLIGKSSVAARAAHFLHSRFSPQSHSSMSTGTRVVRYESVPANVSTWSLPAVLAWLMHSLALPMPSHPVDWKAFLHAVHNQYGGIPEDVKNLPEQEKELSDGHVSHSRTRELILFLDDVDLDQPMLLSILLAILRATCRLRFVLISRKPLQVSAEQGVMMGRVCVGGLSLKAAVHMITRIAPFLNHSQAIMLAQAAGFSPYHIRTRLMELLLEVAYIESGAPNV